MRLRILSDLHLETGDFSPPPADADVVILAGDIHVRRQAVPWIQKYFPSQPVLYVAGNHEFYGSSVKGWFSDLRSAIEGSNICLLENESIQIGDLTFLGCTLWTDFACWPNPASAMQAAKKDLSDFHLIRSDRDWFQPEESVLYHQASLGWLREQLKAGDPARTVIITHHAPGTRSVPPCHAGSILNAAFVSHLEAFIQQTQPALWIHGHTHYSVDYQIGRTRVFSNQRGYVQEPDPRFRPDAVVAV